LATTCLPVPLRLPLGRAPPLWCALCATFVPCTVDAKRVVV
jgi:hypothetical protein